MARAACRNLHFAALAACCLSTVLSGDEPPKIAPRPAAADRTPPSNEQLAVWIRALDADEFLERETAMLQLLEAGPAALPALRPVLTAGSLEATSRAFFVVRQLGLTPNEGAQDQAMELLTDLAARNEAPALARRAAAALAELTLQRSGQALAELEALGAKVSRSQIAGGVFLDEPILSIELGEAYRGTEDDLRRLKWISEAPLLILNGKQVTDGWIARAAAMPGLVELHLYKAAISDAGFAPLAANTTLRKLGVYYTAVGDDVLEPLVKLPLLGFVKLYGTNVRAEAVEKFKTASSVAVDFRRGAFLGVACQDLDVCRISKVTPDSPAGKSGLLKDDIIVRFGGQDVKNFDALTELIRTCDAGDVVDIMVARPVIDDSGHQSRTSISARLELGFWDKDSAVQNSRR